MPKNTSTKSTKTTKKAAPKKSAAKKTSTKKEVTRKIEVKEPVVKTEVKEVTKKVEVKKTETKLERKAKELIAKMKENIPFTVSLIIIVILACALIITLCVKRIPKTSKGDEVVATVNGKKFTADALYKSLKDEYGTDALIKLIDEYIVSKEVTVTDKDKEYAKQIVDYYKDYANAYEMDLPSFLATYVGLPGIYSEKEFEEFVLNDYKKTLAVEKYIGDNASEEDLKAYYKENYSDKLTVKHILIEVDDEEEDTTKADKEAYNKAVELINTLNNTSAKNLDKEFDKLAKDNSDDTATFSNGGLIEDFTKNDVVEEFFNASNELKDGQYTAEPVKTTYGYHIILKVSSTPVEKYKDIKADVKKSYAENLLQTDQTLMISKWDELRKQYKLSIKDDNIKKAYNENIKEGTKKEEK